VYQTDVRCAMGAILASSLPRQEGSAARIVEKSSFLFDRSLGQQPFKAAVAKVARASRSTT